MKRKQKAKKTKHGSLITLNISEVQKQFYLDNNLYEYVIEYLPLH